MIAFVGRLAILALFATFTWAAPVAPRVEHVFIISLDGGKPAVILQSRMPALQTLVDEGAHTWTANTILPSITLPSHTSMLTGLLPIHHRVLWNSWVPSKGAVHSPTIFALAKPAGLSTAMFVGKEKFRHLMQPGTVDKFDFREDESEAISKTTGEKDSMTEGTVLARFVAPSAAAYIIEKKPNLCFIHFTDTDDTGHQYGWGSSEQIGAFADLDAALAVVLQAIQIAGIAKESVVIVTADHGGHAKTHGSNRPADMEIPWIAWGKGVRKSFEITAPVNTCDTAATALWLLGVPAPELFDGHPVTSAFEEASGATTSAASADEAKVPAQGLNPVVP